MDGARHSLYRAGAGKREVEADSRAAADRRRGRTIIWVAFAVVAAGQAQTLAKDILASHNAVRARVKVPALVWSDRLAAEAQNWANTLISKSRFEHRPRSPYG